MALDATLRELESDELLRWDRELQDLAQHPGWVRLQELVAEQREAIVLNLVTRVQDHAVMTHMAGTAKGLDTPARIIETVHDTARAVRRKLEEA